MIFSHHLLVYKRLIIAIISIEFPNVNGFGRWAGSIAAYLGTTQQKTSSSFLKNHHLKATYTHSIFFRQVGTYILGLVRVLYSVPKKRTRDPTRLAPPKKSSDPTLPYYMYYVLFFHKFNQQRCSEKNNDSKVCSPYHRVTDLLLFSKNTYSPATSKAAGRQAAKTHTHLFFCMGCHTSFGHNLRFLSLMLFCCR